MSSSLAKAPSAPSRQRCKRLTFRRGAGGAGDGAARRAPEEASGAKCVAFPCGHLHALCAVASSSSADFQISHALYAPVDFLGSTVIPQYLPWISMAFPASSMTSPDVPAYSFIDCLTFPAFPDISTQRSPAKDGAMLRASFAETCGALALSA